MKRLIIAISRQYGSGGASVAKALGRELGIPVYERQLIELAASKAGLSAEYIDSLEETASRSFLFNLVATHTPGTLVPQYDIPVSFSAYAAQATVIKELASQGSCIIVGRCAEYILRDDPDCVKIFLRAEDESRIARIMERYGLQRKEAEKRLKKMDKGRSNFYRSFTGEEWGNVYNHDLCINTSVTGVDGAVDTVITFLKTTKKL